ncbi:IS630 family transposase, partial [Geodermatophilus sp. TF02-6]
LQRWIDQWNEQARPFKWVKTPDQILNKIARYCARISGSEH